MINTSEDKYERSLFEFIPTPEGDKHYSELCGWLPEMSREAFDMFGHEFAPLEIKGGRDISGARSMLWEIGRKVLGGDPEEYPQSIGDCLISASKVSMADGSEKNIEDVQIGEYVATHKNRSRKVLNTIKKKYTGYLHTVKIKGCADTITTTTDHKFPYLPYNTYRYQYNGEQWVAIDELAKDDYILIPFGINNESSQYEVIDYYGKKIEVNENFARLIGLFLAEGGIHTHKGKLSGSGKFSLGGDELLFAEEIKTYMKEFFDVNIKITYPKTQPNCILCFFYGMKFCKWMKEFIPGKINTKSIPSVFFRSNKLVKLALIRGWMDGDGYYGSCSRLPNNVHCVGESISYQLIHDLYKISLSCGLRIKSYQRKLRERSKIAPQVLSCSGETCLKIFPDKKTERIKFKKIVCDITPYGFASKIKSIETKYVEDVDVYCLEVEEDHSFIVSPFAVSNCVSFGSSHAAEHLQFYSIATDQSNTFTRVFPPYIYGSSRVFVGGLLNSYQDGSVGLWAAKAVMKYGVLSSNTPKCPQYSSNVAGEWGAKGPPLDFLKYGQEHLIKSAALVQTWDDLVTALVNYYPVIVCSDQGFTMLPQADGFHAPSGVWNHCMCIIGVDNDPSNPLACILNNWSDVHGQIIDFRTKEIWPKGCLRVRKSVVERMLSQNDSHAFSLLNTFRSQELGRDFFQFM